jgi:hypothetical protein
MIRILALLLNILCFSPMALAQEWEHKGEVSLQLRRFENDDLESTEDTGLLVFTRVESVYKDDDHRHVFRGFARVDQKDKDRDFMSFEDVYFSRFFGEQQEWTLLAGYKLFNWTATEAFHPADVVNSRNFDSDIEFFEKKGELTMEVSRQFDWGTFSLFMWPRFEQPQFPGGRSRLGFGSDFGRPQAVNGTETGDTWIPQGGLRFTVGLDDGDLSFHLIHHIDRNFPIVGTANYTFNVFANANIPNDVTALQNNPVPYYFKKTQVGGTLQYAFSRLLVKFEGAYRVFEKDLEILSARDATTTELRKPVDHGEAALGFEYTVPFESTGDTTLFFEVGSILGTTKDERARLGAFQRDALFGLRYAFNDIMGSEVFVSFITDLERDNERLFNLSYSRRLSDVWRIQTGLRIYDAPQKGALPLGLEALDGANHVILNLTRFF